MKPSRFLGECVALAAAVLGVVLASAAFADVSSQGGAISLAGFPFPAAVPTTSSTSASSLLARETEVLTRQGISPVRAAQAIDVQGQVARSDLVGKMEAAMGEAYAGVWFEPTTAQLHIGVASPAGRRASESVLARAGLARDVTLTPVRSTWARLRATQGRWDRKLSSLYARAEVESALSAKHNAVSITLSSSVPAGERAALEREAANAGVNVSVTVAASPHTRITPENKETLCKAFAEGKAYCDKPITSGVTTIEPLAPTEPCTAGPLAISESEPFESYLLTAGHCVPNKAEPWDAFNRAGEQKEIGRSHESVFGEGGDYGDILIGKESYWTEPGNEPLFAVTAEWSLAGEEKSYQVIREGKNAEGMLNCHEGQTTGESCGKIKATERTVTYPGPVVVKGLVEDEEAISAAGDSGGPWVFVETSKEVLMLGIHSGKNPETKQTVYEPLHTALEGLKLELLTKNNENRAKDKEEKESKENKEKEEKEAKEARAGVLSSKEQKTWTGGSVGEPILESAKGTKIKCSKETIEGTLALNRHTGTFHANLEGCAEPALKVKCAGSGDKEGSILMSGTWKTVIDSEKPSLGAAILFEPGEFHFTCSIVLVSVKGSVLCLFAEPTSSKTTHELHCEGEKGKPKETEYFNEKSEKVKITPLEASINGGAFEGAAEIASGTMTFAEAVEIMD